MKRRPAWQQLAPWFLAMCIFWPASLWFLWRVDYRVAVGVLLAFMANNIEQRVRQLRCDPHALGGKR